MCLGVIENFLKTVTRYFFNVRVMTPVNLLSPCLYLMTLEHVCYIHIHYFYIHLIFGVFLSSLVFKYGKRKIVTGRREAACREVMFVSGSTTRHILNTGI